MTRQQIRGLFKTISPSPGYILNLSRNELEDLVADKTPYELSDTGSNGKRLEALLRAHDEDELQELLTALLALAGDLK